MCAAIVAALLLGMLAGSLLLGLAVARQRGAREDSEEDAFEVERPRQRVRPNRAELMRHARRLRVTSRKPHARIDRRLTMEPRA